MSKPVDFSGMPEVCFLVQVAFHHMFHPLRFKRFS